MTTSDEEQLKAFLAGRSEQTLKLYYHLVAMFRKMGEVGIYPTKSMIGIGNGQHRIAWVTQLGKDFVHVVFPFKQEYPNNLCFQNIAQVPGQQQYNHHFRMYQPEDVNEEVLSFMKLAYDNKG